MSIFETEEKFAWKKFVVILGLSCLFAGSIMGGIIYYLTKPTVENPTNVPSPLSFVTNTAKDLKIKGNRKSRIYHLPGCPNYGDISERNVIWFKTEEEAENAGFRVAKNC